VSTLLRRRFLQQISLATAIHAAAPRSFPDGQSLRFCIMGDRTGGAVKGVYERTVDLIVAEKPEFVINVGDSIEGLRDFWTDIEWVDMKKIWRRYGSIPHYCTAGNHDIWSANSERLYRQFTGFAPQHSFTHRQCHITVLDNSRVNTLDPDQIDFLRDDLRAHRDVPLKMVFFHKPFWIPHLMLQNSDFPLHQACLEFGVKWVFSGHLHHLWHLQRDGIQYVSIGSSGGSIKRGTERGEGFTHGWFFHYGLLEASSAGVKLTIKELPRPYGESRIVPIEDWLQNRPEALADRV
jgi:hypothetical protein